MYIRVIIKIYRREFIRRMKPETKRKVAGIVALILALIMILSSVSVIFVGMAGSESAEAVINGGLLL